MKLLLVQEHSALLSLKFSEGRPHTDPGLFLGLAVDSLDEVVKSGLVSEFFISEQNIVI